MKIALAAASVLLFSTPFPETFYKGIMRVDRIVDGEFGVVCYLAQNKDGSVHTTPAINCVKVK